MSALRLAFGIGGRVGVIDTENGSADLYADQGDYDVITLGKPYTVAKYREAIDAFERAGYDIIIIDSLSHAWSGSGGLLDKQGQLADKPGVNSYSAWRSITPEHNGLVEAMLSSPCHIIATMRVKTEYVLETNERGKQVPRKVGLQPVQRDGVEYEFTVVLDVDADHRASASKDRTRLFEGYYERLTEATGRMLAEWLDTGTEPKPQATPATYEADKQAGIRDWLRNLQADLAAAQTVQEVEAISERNAVKRGLKKLEGSFLIDLKEMLTDAAVRVADPQAADEPMEEVE
jgi:hypothetical protein